MKKIFQNKWIILLLILVPNFIITYLTTQTVFLYILDANPNRYVTETLLKVYDQIQRFRILTGTNSTERLLKSCEEHLEIINNLLCSNYQAAAKKWTITLLPHGRQPSTLSFTTTTVFNHLFAAEPTPGDDP